MIIALYCLAAVVYLVAGCVSVAVAEATNYLGFGSSSNDDHLGETSEAGAAAMILLWPFPLILLIGFYLGLGPVKAYKWLAGSLTRKLNPAFKEWKPGTG